MRSNKKPTCDVRSAAAMQRSLLGSGKPPTKPRSFSGDDKCESENRCPAAALGSRRKTDPSCSKPSGGKTASLALSAAAFQNAVIDQAPKHYIAKHASATYDSKVSTYKKSLSLAQKLDLVQKPSKPLTDAEWRVFRRPIEAKLQRDVDCPCPICFQVLTKDDPSKRASVVLHPCAHTFHQRCLASYEKFSAQTFRCPMCRVNYTDCTQFVTRELYETHCAARLQRCYRAYMVRKRVYYMFEKKSHLWKKTRMRVIEKSRQDIEDDFLDLDSFFAELDTSVGQARTMMAQSLEPPKLEIPKDQWDWAKEQCLDRGFPADCPICFADMGFYVKTKGSELALLNCGHCFHGYCAESFERFQHGKSEFKCPVCRQGPYERRVWRLKTSEVEDADLKKATENSEAQGDV